MTATPESAALLALADDLRKAAVDFEGMREWHANAVDGDCEPHDSTQVEMDAASKTAIKAADLLARLAAKPADEKVREATIEECAKVAEMWASRIGCHASEIATNIRALSTGAPNP